MKKLFILTTLLLILKQGYTQSGRLFELVKPSDSGISFKNQLDENPKANVLTYEYFYNGGGVAIGDVNNDGLDDIYFSANMKPNRLYLNLGNLKFKDISESAGVLCETGWKTGVSMADVNADGLLDIHVCYSGKGDPEKRRNKLFINNGNLTFSEKAKEYGLNDPSHSTQASFFDFDKDGDLDMYLLNHNVTVIREVEFADAKKQRHPYAGDKLYRNDNGQFVDISEAAGIKGNPLGFGLGVSVSDINKDGWQDIYVSNDYTETDYVYINNKDGTFTDQLTNYMQHISYFSMGVDISDFNNDTWPDIFTLDMLPEDNKRQKLLYGPENYEHWALMVLNGFYFQNMRNMLHLNNGNGTYSEIGQFAGVSNTDWSWSPLFADYDNDGLKDLFITNGYYRDYTNRDFLKYKGDYYFEKAREKVKADTFHLVTSMSSTPLHNYMYKNNGDLTFSDKSFDWGFKDLNFSNGGAYADLDNDGDLELIINNQNAAASIYKNLSRETNPASNYIQVNLKGKEKNTNAIGAKLVLHSAGKSQYFEQIPTRGFQSCVSSKVHIGIGQSSQVDSLSVMWPSGAKQVLSKVDINKIITIEEESTESLPVKVDSTQVTILSKINPPLKYAHIEGGFNDFKRQPLLLTMYTNCGPIMATADLNRDGLVDLFVGGAQDNPGKLFLQTRDGSFLEQPSDIFEKMHTDADAYFFDADNDLDMDLYVVSGGYNDYEPNDKALQDRLYINDGTGKFSKSSAALPQMMVSKSCVTGSDFDHDGDIDLFVGGRVIPGQYPGTPQSFLLRNNAGKFEDIGRGNEQLSKAGMITDAKWVDLNNDGWDDLVMIGEFTSVKVFLNENGKQLKATEKFFDEPLTGLWNRLLMQDFDKDGDQDMILGNFGLNTQLKAKPSQPLSLVYKDFDKNGSIDPILCQYVMGTQYPFASRDELLDQMYSMRSKYTTYESYSDVQLKNIFSKSDLKDAATLNATTLETVYLENAGGKFKKRMLPAEAQFSPVHAISAGDYNKDGHLDFILAGNQSSIRIRMGVVDASFGQLFQGDGKGNFKYVPQGTSGLRVTGDVKSLQPITINRRLVLLIGINNVGVESYIVN